MELTLFLNVSNKQKQSLIFLDEQEEPDRVALSDIKEDLDDIEELSQPMSASQDSFKPSQSQPSSSQASSESNQVPILLSISDKPSWNFLIGSRGEDV